MHVFHDIIIIPFLLSLKILKRLKRKVKCKQLKILLAKRALKKTINKNHSPLCFKGFLVIEHKL